MFNKTHGKHQAKIGKKPNSVNKTLGGLFLCLIYLQVKLTFFPYTQ